MLKSVKRTDSGVYMCSAIDFDNIEAELTGTVTLTVNCEQAKDAHKQTHTRKAAELSKYIQRKIAVGALRR